MKNIGFVGLGHMGNPMVQNLLKADFDVKVFDIAPQAMKALETKGAVSAKSIEDLVKDREVIITMLQTGEQVKEVFKHLPKGVLFIDCSSIEITVTKELHKLAKTSNIIMLDAPVSGGVKGAMDGTLTIMVGADENNFKKALPLLEKLGKKVIHIGPEGHGQAAKICNNLILGISMIAVSEGFTLADKLGLDLKKFFEMSSNASSQCWSITSYCPVPGILPNVPANNQYQPGFMAKMMLKDLRLGLHAAEGVDAITPLGSLAAELYSIFVSEGHGEMDFSGIINLINQ